MLAGQRFVRRSERIRRYFEKLRSTSAETRGENWVFRLWSNEFETQVNFTRSGYSARHASSFFAAKSGRSFLASSTSSICRVTVRFTPWSCPMMDGTLETDFISNNSVCNLLFLTRSFRSFTTLDSDCRESQNVVVYLNVRCEIAPQKKKSSPSNDNWIRWHFSDDLFEQVPWFWWVAENAFQLADKIVCQCEYITSRFTHTMQCVTWSYSVWSSSLLV